VSACGVCGLDPDTIAPPDAIAAVRSFPRRFGAMLEPMDDDDSGEDPDALARRSATPGGPSALDLVSGLTATLRDVAAGVDEAVWGRTSGASAAGGGASVDDALADLDDAAQHLVDVLGRVPAEAWTRTDGQDRTAARLAGEAAHAGSHSLRETERVLAAVRGRPSG
jgi:hypothetical protein